MFMATSLSSSLPTYSSLFLPSQNPSNAANRASILLINLKKPSFICYSSKRKTGFFDQILDYIEGGPKLRKWYGAPDLVSKDGVVGDEDDNGFSEVEEIRDMVLVTDGDSDIGQMVILSLIVKRAKVKAIVKDKRAAIDAFGTYVQVPMFTTANICITKIYQSVYADLALCHYEKAIAGDAGDQLFLKKALRGVRAIICPSNEGFLSNIGSIKGIEHIILLSQLAAYRGSSGIQALMKSNSSKLADKDELAVMASGIPYTIIRAGLLQDSPGGKQGFSFKEGGAAKGRLCKEDAASICIEALNAVPQKGLVFEVVNGGENVSDWKECFASLIQKSEQFQ
ncbi:hypothetical protein Sjap_011839 [Stephania japonica]|uniref:NAD(P)-binding domain-containing protein n=1 Tax=Stephania japonica TaxID=461633 RepID=A0AAP0JBX1_9MAGN